MDKIRAFDELEYGCVNIACATWGHIDKICIDVAATPRERPFFKVGSKAEYKNLPLNQDPADACIVTLRNPVGGLWYGFRPRALLFGSVAAVLHYNFFSRVVGILANLLLETPTANYCDDIGSPAASSISEAALAPPWCISSTFRA